MTESAATDDLIADAFDLLSMALRKISRAYMADPVEPLRVALDSTQAAWHQLGKAASK